jgi:predicted RNA binding protein YcfA (HicA-like mRNA interferase family)
MKVSEVILLLEQEGWILKRITGSHRHSLFPPSPVS